jgi:hypothetical protein
MVGKGNADQPDIPRALVQRKTDRSVRAVSSGVRD